MPSSKWRPGTIRHPFLIWILLVLYLVLVRRTPSEDLRFLVLPCALCLVPFLFLLPLIFARWSN